MSDLAAIRTPCLGINDFFVSPIRSLAQLYPPPLTPPSPGHPDQEPLSLSQIVAMYWRVNQWQATGSIFLTYEGDPPAPDPPVPDMDFDDNAFTRNLFEGNIFNEIDPSDMREGFTLLNDFQQSFVDPTSGLEEWRSSDGVWSSTMRSFLGGNPPIIDNLGQLFTNHITFNILCPGVYFGEYTPFSNHGTPSSVTFDIMGLEQKLWETSNPDYSIVGAVTLKPKTWFTWGGRFDPSTGMPT